MSKKHEVIAYIADLSPGDVDLEFWLLQWAEWVNIKLLDGKRDELVDFIEWAESAGVDLTKYTKRNEAN